GRVRLREPPPIRTPRRTRPRLVREEPDLRLRRATHRRRRLGLHDPRPSPETTPPSQIGPRPHRNGHRQTPPAVPPGHLGHQGRGTTRRYRPCPHLRRALRRLHLLRGDLRRRPAPPTARRPLPRRSGPLRHGPAHRRLGALRPPDPPAVGRAA